MEKRGGRQQAPSKFSVYQNPALSAALTSNSLRPSASTFLFLFSLSSASVLALIASLFRGNAYEANFGFRSRSIPQGVACVWPQIISTVASFVLVGSLLALMKAILLWRKGNATDVIVISPSEGKKELKHLSKRQLGLLGLSSKLDVDSEIPPKETAKRKTSSPLISTPVIPLHHSITSPGQLSRKSSDRLSKSTSDGRRQYNISGSPSSPSIYLVPKASVQFPISTPSLQSSSTVGEQLMSTPWSSKRYALHKDIATEEDLEKLLADLDEDMSESFSKMTTPSPTVSALGMASPSSVSTSGTRRSTPLRPVRMSPGSQKFKTPPKKGEGELPPPMSVEESVEAFKRLGIYPHIELWRDRLRQWFSSVLLNPLIAKIESSHLKVTEAAAKLNIPISISKVGSDTQSVSNKSPVEKTSEWKPSFTVDEDGLLHQLRATLVQVLEASKLPTSNLSPQIASSIPIIQECVDAITEHQRLHALMKGEWAKGLLPHSGIQADYTVSRIRKLAEGTCLKNYEYLRNDDGSDAGNKKWTHELPSDSHLLLYLFCAFLEYPKWMLHVDPTNYAGAQASKNPLFLGILPPKERFPEKYLAVLSSFASSLHPGSCVLAVGKQNPPVFALYWDKKPQFSFQGRTALWDSILILCYKVKTNYDCTIRGLHLGSSALNILPILEQQPEE